MKKFISVLLVIMMFGSFSAFAATQTYPVSLSVEAVVGEKPVVSSQDALGLDVPAETLTFVEDNDSMLIAWKRADYKFEYWEVKPETFEDDPTEYDNAFRIAVCSFAEMCDGNYTMLIYSDNNGNAYILSPYATQDISENIYNNYNDFQIFVMVDSVQ